MMTKKYSHTISFVRTLAVDLYDPCRPVAYHSISYRLYITSDFSNLVDSLPA